MNPDIELGRIASVRIGVNWSWLIVFALIVWTLASNVFPSQNPGLADGTYLAMAVTAAIVFFASLLLHELGHANQARRENADRGDNPLALRRRGAVQGSVSERRS